MTNDGYVKAARLYGHLIKPEFDAVAVCRDICSAALGDTLTMPKATGTAQVQNRYGVEPIDNLKPELQRDKLDEWKAAYAALFNQLNPVFEALRQLATNNLPDGGEVPVHISLFAERVLANTQPSGDL